MCLRLLTPTPTSFLYWMLNCSKTQLVVKLLVPPLCFRSKIELDVIQQNLYVQQHITVPFGSELRRHSFLTVGILQSSTCGTILHSDQHGQAVTLFHIEPKRNYFRALPSSLFDFENSDQQNKIDFWTLLLA